ncbi:MAG: hypothetical protein R3E79_40205 [Caldilineaceae bacterium]
MSQRIHKVSWFYLLILFLPMLACNSLPELKGTAIINQQLRQNLEAIPLAAPTFKPTLTNMNRKPQEMSVAEAEQIRLTMQQAWRAIFLPPQPYHGLVTWRRQQLFSGITDDPGAAVTYQVVAFDQLSAEVTSAALAYRCIQDGEKSFFTKSSTPGTWTNTLRETVTDPVGGPRPRLITDCNEGFLGLLAKTTDPFAVSHVAEPTTWYYPITAFGFDPSLEAPITPAGTPAVGYRMISKSIRIEIWVNAETSQPLSMAYSDGQYVIYWRLTGLLDELVIETPQVTQ